MGLPGFEPESKEPKSSSLDQTSRQPLSQSLEPPRTINDFALIIKTLTKLQHLSKANQKAIWNRLTYLGKLVDLKRSAEVEQYIYSKQCKNNYKNELFESFFRFSIIHDYITHVVLELDRASIPQCSSFHLSKLISLFYELQSLSQRRFR